jgi:hypothetical protein
VTLVSAPGAAGYAGVGWLHALGVRLGCQIIADCDDDAGLVLAGLRTGLRCLVYRGPPEILGRLRDIASQQGADVRGGVDVPVLALGFGEEPARAFARWVAQRQDGDYAAAKQ